jgi:hypothetical protein
MKKIYNQPIVEQAEMLMGSIVMAGSPGALQNSGSGTSSIGGGDPIVGG